MPLDFKRATDLFLGREDELALALGIEPDTLTDYRRQPAKAPTDLVSRLADVLMERGRGMMRVGELLADAGGPSGGNGRRA
ncbi:MAG TPA: hypothetical protein VJ957_03100 [Longimicrobiales bacterium]|nr:hypothetical protein [Longimicrobiales bacterium]